MKTLLIPCAGRSSRFPNTKPKYLLTHPDGGLMIEHSIRGIDIEQYDQIIVTIVKEHDEQYNASLILKQAFSELIDNKKFKLCILESFTKSASETVCQTIAKCNITGQLIIKDCDNYVNVNLPKNPTNLCVGIDVNKYELSNITSKSFLYVNEQNLIKDIIEKKVVSDTICVGVYGFSEAKDFVSAYNQLLKKGIESELYISHVISYMINALSYCFEAIYANDYEDWGTINEWLKIQNKMTTYFIDVDGVIFKNSGKYGLINWCNNDNLIESNVAKIIELQKNGSQIIITTSRTEEYREALLNKLNKVGIHPHAVVMGLNHSCRVIINDFAPTNPYPSAKAINIPRNGDITKYL